jgi:hypothetical protein
VKIDFAAHNEESRRVWEAYRGGKPFRVPMVLGVNPRYTMFDHPANPRGITYEQYWSDPQSMLERNLEHAEWCAFNLVQDAEMGLPDKWTVGVDFQNVYEAVAHGCSIVYCHNQVPDTRPLEDPLSKSHLLDRLIPDPFDNPAGAEIWKFHDHFVQKEREGFEWKGRPISVTQPSGLFTDGPVTGACNLLGAMEFCLDLVEDPAFADDLLSYLTETIIARITAYRERLGMPPRSDGFLYADDSIALLSTEMVCERVLPHHRRLLESLSMGGPNSIHLCGDATRHFPMLKEELNIRSFDTGFPVDFCDLRATLGDDVEILGGPSVPFLTNAEPEEVFDETARILNSGIKSGGRFVLREGNNLAPEVSPANVAAMYEAVKIHGHFPEQV